MKALARGLCSLIFKFCLYMLAITLSVVVVFGSPKAIKHSLRKSKIYDAALDNLIQSAQHPKEGESNSGLTLSDPTIQNDFKQAFPPEFLQQTVEKAIDDTYVWLKGSSPQPNYTVDLTSNKQKLATLVGQYAAQRYASLPVCTKQQASQLNTQDQSDPLSLTCQLPNVSAASVAQQVTEKLSGTDGPLGDKTTFTSADLPKNSNGQTVFQQFQQIPHYFQLFLLAPWVFGGILLLSGLGLLLLHDKRRRALQIIGRTTLIAAILIGLSGIAVNLVFNAASKGGGPLAAGSGTLKQPIITAANDLNNQMNQVLYVFAGVCGVIGLGMLLGLRFTRPPKEQVSSEDTERSEEAPSHEVHDHHTKHAPHHEHGDSSETEKPAADADKAGE